MGKGMYRNGGVLKAKLVLASILVMAGSPVFAEESAISLVAQLDAQYDSAWNTLDAHKLAEQFAEDAIVLPPTSPTGTGTRAVLDFFEPLFKNKWSNHKLQPITAQRLGDSIIVAASRKVSGLEPNSCAAIGCSSS